MRPLWRDVWPSFGSYLDAPYAMDESTPEVPEDYRKWARFEADSMRAANRDGVILAVLDYILTHPEFPLMEFAGFDERAVLNEAQLREILRIAREEVFPDAPPMPVDSVAQLDPSGLLDKTPEVGFKGSERPS